MNLTLELCILYIATDIAIGNGIGTANPLFSPLISPPPLTYFYDLDLYSLVLILPLRSRPAAIMSPLTYLLTYINLRKSSIRIVGCV